MEEHTGIRLPPAKRTMVEGRLRKRIRALGLTRVEDYGHAIFEGGKLNEEFAHLIDCVTTNKTDFFREPDHFDFLRDTAMPLLASLRSGAQSPFKFWSAAASIGAEAYTIAMVAAEIANSQLTASYLAQEGIEYVRMVRDNDYLSAYQSNQGTASAAGWSNFLSSVPPLCGTSCQLDPANAGTPLAACSGASCTPLYLSVTKIYTQSATGTVTPYTRTIQAAAVSSNEEKITSTVSWNFHGTAYSETITDHLTPWQ